MNFFRRMIDRLFAPVILTGALVELGAEKWLQNTSSFMVRRDFVKACNGVGIHRLPLRDNRRKKIKRSGRRENKRNK